MKKILFFLLIYSNTNLFAQTEEPVAQVDTTTYKKVKYPIGYEAKIDEVYKVVNDWKGREDIYFNPKAEKPTPVIFNIHGGGWNKGVKEAQGGFNIFFAAGMAVVNVEYRLSSQATAPAAVEDVRAAMLYVVKNAKKLNIDPHQIVIMGGSAGGHLALMAGLLKHNKKFDGEYKRVKKYTIAAIIDKSGITDVWDWAYGKIKTSKSATQWLGEKAKDSVFAKSVSPIWYVEKSSPPTLIVHGDADPTVPYQHSVDLKKKLDEAGVKNEFLTVKGGDHGKNYTKEQKTEISNTIIKFLTELKIIGKS